MFNQGKPTPDPTRFQVPHPSDALLYAKIQALLYEDVVGFPPSRAAPADVYELAAALGPHGTEMVQAIQSNGQIVFHLVGDIGASTAGKYHGRDSRIRPYHGRLSVRHGRGSSRIPLPAGRSDL